MFCRKEITDRCCLHRCDISKPNVGKKMYVLEVSTCVLIYPRKSMASFIKKNIKQASMMQQTIYLTSILQKICQRVLLRGAMRPQFCASEESSATWKCIIENAHLSWDWNLSSRFQYLWWTTLNYFLWLLCRGRFIYILDSSNSSSFTFWYSQL